MACRPIKAQETGEVEGCPPSAWAWAGAWGLHPSLHPLEWPLLCGSCPGLCLVLVWPPLPERFGLLSSVHSPWTALSQRPCHQAPSGAAVACRSGRHAHFPRVAGAETCARTLPAEPRGASHRLGIGFEYHRCYQLLFTPCPPAALALRVSCFNKTLFAQLPPGPRIPVLVHVTSVRGFHGC